MKRIPDPASPGRLDQKTRDLVREGKLLMDDPDSYGVEMGLQLAAKAGGRAERRRTGKTVKPTVYLAVGISGAARDLVGMKNSKNITAINKDEEAPILAISDLGVIGDARKICLNSSKRWKPAADRAMGASSGE